jgi:hypothetical protein
MRRVNRSTRLGDVAGSAVLGWHDRAGGDHGSLSGPTSAQMTGKCRSSAGAARLRSLSGTQASLWNGLSRVHLLLHLHTIYLRWRFPSPLSDNRPHVACRPCAGGVGCGSVAKGAGGERGTGDPDNDTVTGDAFRNASRRYKLLTVSTRSRIAGQVPDDRPDGKRYVRRHAFRAVSMRRRKPAAAP